VEDVAGRHFLLPPLVERILLTAGLLTVFLVGYFGVGRSLDTTRAHELASALDARIPFIAATIWIYLWVFPAAFVPVFVVRCRHLFRRTVLAYAVVIGVSLAVFALFPVTSLGLRVAPETLDTLRFSPWAVAKVYEVDPPFNLFPSLHLSTAAVAAFAVWKARRSLGIIMFLGVGLIGISVCTVKQHFVIDGVAGLVLASAAFLLFLRAYRPAPATDPSFTWRGPALFLALVAIAFAALYVAFRSGT